MKPTVLTRITGTALFAVLAMPAQIVAHEQPHYVVTDLGIVGGPPGQPYVITNNGLISGAAAIPGGRMHAVIWYKGRKLDTGARGLKGRNSAAFGVNEKGLAVGEADTLELNDEDFCGFNAFGFPSPTACLPFFWKDGVMTKLPTLGGPNGVANMINDRGEVVGYAENETQENAVQSSSLSPSSGKMARSRNSRHSPATGTESRLGSMTTVGLSARRGLGEVHGFLATPSR